jgi:hypothetical protein
MPQPILVAVYIFTLSESGEPCRQGKQMDHKTWVAVLAGCHAQRRRKQWSIGDAINNARQNWTDKWGRRKDLWQEAADATGHPVTSLMQYARVAAVFPPKQRLQGLPFGAFQIIAGFESEKKRWWLINKAAEEELSCEQVRQIVQKLQKKKVKSPEKKLTVKVTVYVYSALRNTAIEQHTTVRKLAAQLLSAAYPVEKE